MIKRIVLIVAAASALVAQTPDPKDPLYRAKGDHKRQYSFAEAGEMSPYRVYVPASWAPDKRFPLVVMLHGGGLTQDAAFDREPADLKGVVFREADKHEFILVAPMGHKGEYGNTYPMPNRQAPPPDKQGVDPEVLKRNNMLSEKDVLNVLELVSKEYNVDRSRTFLMGNSMGMLGTMSLTAKFPERWTAIGPSDGPGEPSSYPYENFKALAGVMIVHGDSDRVAPIAASREIAANIKALGVDTQFLEVKGGEHGTAWYMALPQIFDFFESHSRRKGH